MRLTHPASNASEGRRWTESLHVWVVSSFAVAQPLYALLAAQAEFFVFQNAGRSEILGLVFILSGALPLGLIVVEVGAGLIGAGTRRRVHQTILAAGVALTVLPVLRPIEFVSGLMLVYVALLIGVAAAMLYARLVPVRLFFTLLAPAVVIFPGMFLFASPVTPLLMHDGHAGAREAGTIGRPAPIVFVILDEFPLTSLLDERLQIDAERYPNFAALARDANWYRRATTVGDTTHDALPAILTGRYPSPDRLPHMIDHPHNLFTLLAGAYDMTVAGHLTQLCPKDLCARVGGRGAAQRLREMLSDIRVVYLHLLLSDDLRRALLPSIAHKWKGFGGETGGAGPRIEQLRHVKGWFRNWYDRMQQGRDFIRGIGASGRPSLHFLHWLLPHYPYQYLPSGRRYSTEQGMLSLLGKTVPERRHVSDPFNVLQLYQRHLLQVGAVDTWLGDLLDHLRRIGLYDETLLVLTADHGISFRPGDHYRRPTETTFQDIMPVPLFIKAPFQKEGRIDDRPTELVDILPSITDLIETRLPWPVDGRSVLEPAPQRSPRIHRFPDGAPATFTGLNEAMERAVRRRHKLFGSGPWYPALSARGPHQALIGKKIDEVAGSETTDLELTVDQAEMFAGIDPESDFIPAHITGQVLGVTADHGRLALAVAVNGTVEAVVEPWKVRVRGRDGAWSAVVPEAAFRPGKNTVEVLVITEAGGETRIARQGDPLVTGDNR